MSLNRNQILAIIIATLAVFMASTAQLNELFGPHAAKLIISAAALCNGILSAILAILTGQSGMMRDVVALPGVSSIKVNAQANPTLARMAMDPTVDKVSPTEKDFAAVTKQAMQ